MQPIVAHFVESYGLTGESYVADQVRLTRRYVGKLTAERKLLSGFNPIPDTAAFVTLPSGVRTQRLYQGLTKRLAPKASNAIVKRFFSRRIEALEPSILHGHFGPSGWRLIDAKRRTGLPLVVTFYGNDISELLRNPVWVGRYKEMFAAADRLIVLLDEGIERLARLGCPTEKVTVWDIGIAIEEYSFKKKDMTERPIRLLIAARFTEKKGHLDLLDAIARLLKKQIDVRLSIVGHGPLSPLLRHRIAELKLERFVEVVDMEGRSDFFDLFKQYLDKSHIFVMPSVVAPNGDDEGGPPVVLSNAMAAGLPIVSTAVGGITRAVHDGETGVICGSKDPASLAAKIEQVVNDPTFARRLSEQARCLAEERFSLDRQIGKLEAIYDRVLEQHRR